MMSRRTITFCGLVITDLVWHLMGKGWHERGGGGGGANARIVCKNGVRVVALDRLDRRVRRDLHVCERKREDG